MILTCSGYLSRNLQFTMAEVVTIVSSDHVVVACYNASEDGTFNLLCLLGS